MIVVGTWKYESRKIQEKKKRQIKMQLCFVNKLSFECLPFTTNSVATETPKSPLEQQQACIK